TPVSALIHAATMVTAGVYLIARSMPLFTLAPGVLALVSVTGCATALLAASIAVTQNDLKRVMAYSTVSQLGYMFMALGAGVGNVASSLSWRQCFTCSPMHSSRPCCSWPRGV